jgi:hypothetical protein
MNHSKKDYYLSFEDARTYARSLKIKGRDAWEALRRAKKIPENVPTSPETFYKNQWCGWGDWLGHYYRAQRSVVYKKRMEKERLAKQQGENLPLPKLPSLTALSKIIQEVQAEQQNPQTDKLPPNHWTIRRALTDYAKARVDVLRYKIIPSAGVKIDLDGNRVFILVQSEEEKELVQSEIHLMEYLRATVQLDGVALIVQAWQPVTE